MARSDLEEISDSFLDTFIRLAIRPSTVRAWLVVSGQMPNHLAAQELVGVKIGKKQANSPNPVAHLCQLVVPVGLGSLDAT